MKLFMADLTLSIILRNKANTALKAGDFKKLSLSFSVFYPSFFKTAGDRHCQ